jgi:hypothetical protein
MIYREEHKEIHKSAKSILAGFARFMPAGKAGVFFILCIHSGKKYVTLNTDTN